MANKLRIESLNSQFMKLLFDYLGINLFAIDKAGKYILKNEVLTTIVGETKRADTVDKAAWDSCQKVMQNKEIEVIEERYKDRWYLSIKAPLFDNKDAVVGVLGIATDITERKDITKRKELEEELTHARQGIESANKAKSDFLSIVNYELRTPLTAIAGQTESLKHGDKLTEVQRDSVESIDQAGRRLLTLLEEAMIYVDEFDEISEPFDLLAMIEDMVKRAGEEVKKQKVTWLIDYDPGLPQWFRGDCLKIRKLVSRLLSNALRFTDRGRVTMNVMPAHAPKEGVYKLRLRIQDTGCGMPADQVGRIQSLFDDDIGEVYQHPGLNVAICHNLSQALGGHLTIESKPRQGTTVTVTLSLRVEEPLSREAGTVLRKSRRRHPRVLIVEDNVSNSQALVVLLQQLGCLSEVADDGEAAKRCLRAKSKVYELILLDINLPDMSGIELAKLFRATDKTKEVPIVAVTAHGSEEDIARCAEAGIDDVLIKPVYLSALDYALERHVFGQKPSH